MDSIKFGWDNLKHLYPEFTSWEELCAYKAALFSKCHVKAADHRAYEPHEGQGGIHYHPWQFSVHDWGRRGGKTQGAAGEGLVELSLPNRQAWVVAPTYVLTDKVFRLIYYWVVTQGVLGHDNVQRALYNPRGERLIQMRWGSVLEGKTCESPKSLLGEGNHLIILDEAAQLPDANIWETYLEPTLTDYKGRAMFISTPRGYNWFYDMWMHGMENKSLQEQGWYSTQRRSEDNPYLDRDFIEEKKLRLDPVVFRQEYEASFEARKGLVYEEFKDRPYGEGGHLFDPDRDRPTEFMTHYRAIDPGLANPTAVLWAAVDEDGNVWVYDEYEVAGGLVKGHADNIRAKTRFPVTTTVIDPSAANRNPETGRSVQDIYRDGGIFTVPAQNDISFGIQTVKEYLRATLEDSPTHPKLYISRNCLQLRICLNQYEWDETVSVTRVKNDPDRPRQWKDHLPDALRYLLAMKPVYIPYMMRMNQIQEETEQPAMRGVLGRPSTGG